MTTLLTALADLGTRRKALMEELKDTLKPGLRQFMVDHPDVKKIGWKQFTPYFNDGDTCEFSVHELWAEAKSQGDPSDDEVESDDYREGWSKDDFSEQTNEDLVQLNKALQNAGDDLKEVFGDHIEVIVTRRGVSIEEYEHE